MPLKFNLKKILVPTDFSEHSMGALRYAAAMAKHSEAEVLAKILILLTEDIKEKEFKMTQALKTSKNPFILLPDKK